MLLNRNLPFIVSQAQNAAGTTNNYMKKVSIFAELGSQIMANGVILHKSQPPYPSEATQMPSREVGKCKSPKTLNTQ